MRFLCFITSQQCICTQIFLFWFILINLCYQVLVLGSPAWGSPQSKPCLSRTTTPIRTVGFVIVALVSWLLSCFLLFHFHHFSFVSSPHAIRSVYSQAGSLIQCFLSLLGELNKRIPQCSSMEDIYLKSKRATMNSKPTPSPPILFPKLCLSEWDKSAFWVYHRAQSLPKMTNVLLGEELCNVWRDLLGPLWLSHAGHPHWDSKE